MEPVSVKCNSFRFTINLTETITRIIVRIVEKVPLYAHINTDELLICIASNRHGCKGGTYGKLVPLRFKSGVKMLRYQGHYYAMPSIIHHGNEIKYLIYFYMPRFLDLHPRDKLKVIFHELYHINPEFNGDIRRISRNRAYHGNTKKSFDSIFEHECEQFFNQIQKDELFTFLKMNTADIYSQYDRVYGRRMKLPKPILSGKF